MKSLHLDSTGDPLEIEQMADGIALTATVGEDQATVVFSSAEAFLPVLKSLESHALALGWIGETKDAEIVGLKKELAQARHHADHSDWLAGNFSDQMESFQAEAGDANDKMETLRTTIEQWKREAESNLAIVKSKPYEEGEDMYNRSLDGEALILRVERDAYNKVLRLLAGNATGEGEGGER